MGKQPKQRKCKDFLEDQKPIRYWSVEHTLTSGEVHTFYVKAIDQGCAYKKAEEWAIILETCPKAKGEGFRLRH